MLVFSLLCINHDLGIAAFDHAVHARGYSEHLCRRMYNLEFQDMLLLPKASNKASKCIRPSSVSIPERRG